MAAVKNRRRFLRTKGGTLVAHLRIGDRLIPAPIEDISMSGMLARSAESLPAGTALMFDLVRPGLKRPLRLLGVVIDMRAGRGLGIRFDGMDRDATLRLEELITDLGGFTYALQTDKGEDVARTATMPMTPAAVPAPVPASVMPPTSPFSAPTSTGTFRAPGMPASQADVDKMQQQLRTMVMELGTAQETIAQKEKDLQHCRFDVDQLRDQLREQLRGAGPAAVPEGQGDVEVTRLQEQLSESRARNVELEREAETASAAIARMLDTMRRPL